MVSPLKTACLVCLALWGVGVAQADPVVLHLTPGSQTLEVGEVGSVSLVLEDSLTVRTAAITLQGDPAIIDQMVCLPGAVFNGVSCNLWEESREDAPGVWSGFVVIIGASCQGLGPGELLRWEFTAAAGGVTDLLPVSYDLFDGHGDVYSDVQVDGAVEIRVGGASGTPVLTDLFQVSCYPNPFNPTTTLRFTLPEPESVRVAIYDVNGRLVRTLLDGFRAQGTHEVVWNGRGDEGRLQASGMYFSRIEAGPHSQVRKVIMAK